MVDATIEKTFAYNEARADGRGVKNRQFNDGHFPLNKKAKRCEQTFKSSSAYVQILGTGMDTHDTLPSILLFFDNFRIIFNAGEGLQRFCAEHKIKLSKIDYICLSRVCSETVGGLPGLLLTLAGMGEGRAVNLRGPSDLNLLVDAMKTFIPHAAIVANSFESCLPSHAGSHTQSCHSEDLITVCANSNIKISAILLQPITSVDDSSVKLSDKSVVYICELPIMKGKFHVKKAEELGVRAGPKYRELQDGKSVKSDCLDKTVHPSEVMDPPIPGPIVLIVDCPTEYHAEKLLNVQSLSSYYSDNLDGGKRTLIIHLTPASVVSSPYYRSWMAKFRSAQHILAGQSRRNTETPILKSSARITQRLNYLCPKFFPAASRPLEHQNDADAGPIDVVVDSIICAENLLKFTLHPHSHLGLDKSNVPSPFSPSEVISDLLLEIPEIEEGAQQVAQLWRVQQETEMDTCAPSNSNSEVMIGGPSSEDNALPDCLENICRDDVEIVLLGTGSSHPSKYRNVSSIYVNLFSEGGLLLDCGEGTLAQLRRRYGIEGASDVVRNLRCIWISHIHADHHAGLVRLLALRRELLKGTPHEPLHVIGPKLLAKFLDKYNILEDLDMQFLDCSSTTASSWDGLECGRVLTECQILLSDSIKSELKKDGNEEKVELTSSVKESCSQSCSERQKEHGVNFTLLKSLKYILREAGLERLISFPVKHCPQAFGVILKARQRMNNVGDMIPGWKVVYSGDTRPCVEVIKASQGATLLIHEATFEDGLAEEAVARNHSTTKEAIEVGNTAGVYRVVLTHFSQRYPKIPAFDEINLRNTCIAFDLMSINMADLLVLPHVLPYIKLLFRNDVAETLEDCSDEY